MKTILIIESHPDIQKIIEILIVRDFDVQIKSAANLEQAIHILSDQEIDLVILSGLSNPRTENFDTIRSVLKTSRPWLRSITFIADEIMSAEVNSDEKHAVVGNMEFKELVAIVRKFGFARKN